MLALSKKKIVKGLQVVSILMTILLGVVGSCDSLGHMVYASAEGPALEPSSEEKTTGTTTEATTTATTTEKATEKETEKTTAKVTEKATEKATEKTTEKATEKVTEKSSVNSTETKVEASTENKSGSTTQKQANTSTEAIPQSNEPGDTSAFYIEQVHENMPEIIMYCYAKDRESLEVQNMQGYLGDELLHIEEIRAFSDSNEGIDYYVIMDATMDKSDISEITAWLNEFPKQLSKNDTVTVYTMGKALDCVIDHAKRNEEVVNSVSEIKSESGSLEMAPQIGELVESIGNYQKNGKSQRSIIISLTGSTGWSSDSITCATQKEALLKADIPVYAWFIGSKESQINDDFADVAKVSGGQANSLEKKEIKDVLDGVVSQFEDCYVVKFRASSNQVNYDFNSFRLVLTDENIGCEKNVWLDTYQGDTVAPEVVQVKVSDSNKLQIVFSESLSGAEQVNAYRIVSESGDECEVLEVEYGYDETLSAFVVTLTMKEPIDPKEYTIEFMGITDASMEKNVLPNTYSFTGNESNTKKPIDISGSANKLIWIIVGLVVVIAVVVTLIVVTNKKKNVAPARVVRKPETYMDDDLDYQSTGNLSGTASQNNVVKSNTLKGNPASDKLQIAIYRNGRKEKNIEVKIDGSLIIGRSDLSDIYFDDEQLSRQHFVLEYDQGQYYVSDLETTNGTRVNGKKISGKHCLKQNDKIMAGNMEFVVRW